jgi:hypothetical protein
LKRLIPQQSEKPQRNPDERRRYEEPGEGDGRKNQEETKKKTETSNTVATRTVNNSPLADCHTKDRTATRKMQRKKRRPSEQERWNRQTSL